MKPDTKPRRTQAERRDTTRKALIDAAIVALAQRGYAGVSTNQVCEAAKVSRGAMLHHFASRVDLMMAVAEAVHQEHVTYYSEHLNAEGTVAERLSRLIDAAWHAHTQPSTVALHEIWMATRADKELAARFRPFQAASDARATRDLVAYLPDSGLNEDASAGANRFLVAALRGLAIDRAMGRSAEEQKDEIAALKAAAHALLINRQS
jgi:AcrR family transcriptional regulator